MLSENLINDQEVSFWQQSELLVVEFWLEKFESVINIENWQKFC